MIISNEIRFAVTVEQKVCNEEPLSPVLLRVSKIVAREDASGKVLAVLLKPSYDSRVKGLDAECSLVSVQNLGKCLGCLYELTVRLDLDDERDLAVYEL